MQFRTGGLTWASAETGQPPGPAKSQPRLLTAAAAGSKCSLSRSPQ